MKRKIRDDDVRRRLRRAMRIRKRVEGDASTPRLAVYRSAGHIYAQLIDDRSGRTLAAASTLAKGVRDEVKGLNKTDAAAKVGAILAQRAQEAGIESCVFDRKGWPFHGRIAALAQGAREGGLQF